MEVYVIFENNQEEYEDYKDWILEIYGDKDRAEKRFLELVANNFYKKDRIEVDLNKYYEVEAENIGAYRLEKHKLIK